MKKVGLFILGILMAFSIAFATPAEKQITLMLTDSASGITSQTILYFDVGLNPNYVYPQDAEEAFDSSFTIPQIYSFTADHVPCYLNGCGNFTSSAVIPIGIRVNGNDTYVISQTQIANFDAGSMILLEDRQLGVIVDLRLHSYPVNITQQGRIDGRFFLHISYPPQITYLPADCSNQNGPVQIREDGPVTWSSCYLYDSSSSLIQYFSNVTGNFSFPNLNAASYTVEFNYGSDAVDKPSLLPGGLINFTMSASSIYASVDQQIQFSCQSTNVTDWIWDFGDGGTIHGIANPTYSYINEGVYPVTLICSNQYNCTSNGSLTMHIAFDSTLSIGSISADQVKISNTNKDIRISVSSFMQGDYYYEVSSLTGQALSKGPINTSDFIIAANNLSTGVYIVTVSNNAGKLSKKIFLP